MTMTLTKGLNHPHSVEPSARHLSPCPGERKGTFIAAGASSPPSIGGEVASPGLAFGKPEDRLRAGVGVASASGWGAK